MGGKENKKDIDPPNDRPAVPTTPLHSLLPSPARLPGIGVESSNIGWDALTGALDEFGPESYLGPNSMAPDSAPVTPPVDTHSAMEAALRLGTAPVARGV